MTVILPNYILKNAHLYKIESDKKFVVSKSNILNSFKPYIFNRHTIIEFKKEA